MSLTVWQQRGTHCLCHTPLCVRIWHLVLFRLESSDWRDSSCLQTYVPCREFVGCTEALKAEKRNIVS